jgi:hypothetical protein
LAKPGGNVTGFMIYEYGLGAKRLTVKRVFHCVTLARLNSGEPWCDWPGG